MIKMNERSNGTVRLDFIGSREIYDGREYENEPEKMVMMQHPDTNEEDDFVRVGDKGVLVTTENEYGDDDLKAWMWGDEDGYPGNSNREIKERNGWRGTTNGRACYAHGYREVLEISPRKRGVGFYVILSEEISD